MVDTKTPYGIPSVELERLDGGTVNPASFIGHELVVLFCPADADAAAHDVADYARHTKEFCDSDAWIIGICKDEAPPCEHGAGSLTMVHDHNGLAWNAFENLLGGEEQASREAGAVFLFDRGGSLRRAWAGPGHAAEVSRAVGQRQ